MVNKLENSLSEDTDHSVALQHIHVTGSWKGRLVNQQVDLFIREKVEISTLAPTFPLYEDSKPKGLRTAQEAAPKENSAKVDLLASTVLDTNTPQNLETLHFMADAAGKCTLQTRSPAEAWLLDRISFHDMPSVASPSNHAAKEELLLLKTNLEFLLDPQKIPFRGCLSAKFDIIQTLSNINPKVTWIEAYKNCRQKLASQLESFRPIIQKNKAEANEPSKKLYEYADQITNGKLEICKAKEGCGGAYYCKDESQELRAILKSVNSDVGTIDNQKGFNHPFQTSISRPTANYESVLKEVLAYELSLAFECLGSVPPTILTTITYQFDSYFDHPTIKKILKICPEEVKIEIIARLGGEANPERLCSLQQAVKTPLLLNEVIMNWGRPGFEAIEFNQENYEDVMIMTRLLGETDGHSDNYLLTKKEVSNDNCLEKKEQYFLVKVDSGFSLPKVNRGALNCLTSLPNAKYPISARYRQKVLATDSNKFKLLAEKYKLDKNEVTAAYERIEFMKDLVRIKPDITHREFELRLRLFSGMGYQVSRDLVSRKEFALKNYKLDQLKELKQINRMTYRVRDSVNAVNQVKAGGLVKTGFPWRKEIKMIQKSKAQIVNCTIDLESLEKSNITTEGSTYGDKLKEEITRIKIIMIEWENQIKALDVFGNNLDHKFEKKRLKQISEKLDEFEKLLISLVEGKTSIPYALEVLQKAHQSSRSEAPQLQGDDNSDDTYYFTFLDGLDEIL